MIDETPVKRIVNISITPFSLLLKQLLLLFIIADNCSILQYVNKNFFCLGWDVRAGAAAP